METHPISPLSIVSPLVAKHHIHEAIHESISSAWQAFGEATEKQGQAAKASHQKASEEKQVVMAQALVAQIRRQAERFDHHLYNSPLDYRA